MNCFQNDDAQTTGIIIACFIIAILGIILGEILNKYFFSSLISNLLIQISLFMPNTSIFSDNAENIKTICRITIDFIFVIFPIAVFLRAATQGCE